METHVATSLAGIAVAMLAAASAYASQRAAARASVTTGRDSNRVDMEKEAYERARAFDTETIRRQDVEIAELRADNADLRKQVSELTSRITRLERKV